MNRPAETHYGRLGFYALRAGLRAALRAGLRTAPRVGPLDHATRRAAGPCYAPSRAAGPPGHATRTRISVSLEHHLKKPTSKSQGHKRDPFVVPTYPKEYQAEANARVSASLNQVDPSLHLNLQGKRNTATLYVRSLEFKTSEQDLRKSLDLFFQWA